MKLPRIVGVLGFVCFLSVFNFSTELQAKDASISPIRYAPIICRFNVSLYVYDDLPAEFSTDIERHFFNDTMLRSGNWDNLHTEHTFVQLFRSSPCRTNDTSLADFFVVPYMHLSDCMTTSILFGGYGPHCRQINSQMMRRFLEYLRGKETFALHGGRHLFLTMYHDFMMREEMTKFPLRIMSSPQDVFKPGHIVVPLVNLSPKFQPSKLLGYNDDWWTRPRKYAFSAFYGRMNPKMSPNQPIRFRKHFFATLDKRERLQKQQEIENVTLAGMPYAAGLLQKGNSNKTVDAYDAYQNSIFCPILPGDMPFARRVFDVMFHGCLPVFMRWPMNDNGGKSWFVPGEFEAKYNYPFYREVFAGPPFFLSDDDVIDYESFVVEAVGDPSDERNFDSMFVAMETMIKEFPDEIKQRQMRLKGQVVGLTCGLGEDAHQFNDVFSRVMKILENVKIYGKDYI